MKIVEAEQQQTLNGKPDFFFHQYFSSEQLVSDQVYQVKCQT